VRGRLVRASGSHLVTARPRACRARWRAAAGWALALAACAAPPDGGGGGEDDGPPVRADSPEPPRAASYVSAPLERELAHAAQVVETRGYAAKGPPWRGFLVQQSPSTRALRLRSGQCIVVAAAASPAVRELDLRVFDADGGEVGQDALAGRSSALRFCPSQSGTYYLVARATAGNGLFTSRRFVGPSGLEIRVDDIFPPLEPLRGDEAARSAGDPPVVGRP